MLFLLSLKANIDAKDKEGITPLNLAVSSKREKIVRILLQKGADKSIENPRHETPLQVAMKKNYYDLILLLKDKDYNPLCTLDTPIEYVQPEPMYRKVIFVFLIVPEVILFFCVLPYLDLYEIIANGILFVLAMLTYKTLIDKGHELKQYCPTCYVKKTTIGKHCFLCDKCIEGFEHHCFWINKCIGKRNIIAYFVFLLFGFVFTLSAMYDGMYCILNDVYVPEQGFLEASHLERIIKV